MIDRLKAQAAELQKSTVAGRTRKQYKYCYKNFETFVSEIEGGEDYTLISQDILVLFIPWLQDHHLTFYTIRQVITGTRFMLKEIYGRDLLDFNQFSKTLKGLSKTLNHFTNHRRDPIMLDTLKKLVDSIKGDAPVNIQLRALFLTMYSGMLRSNDISNIPVNTVVIENDKITLRITSSKTDQCGESQTVVIKKLKEEQSSYCAYRALIKHIQLFSIREGPLFFAPLYINSPPGERRPISYSTIRYRLERSLDLASIPSLKISTHSFRIGSATQAAENGIPERIIQRHGRWISERVRVYIRESKERISDLTIKLFE